MALFFPSLLTKKENPSSKISYSKRLCLCKKEVIEVGFTLDFSGGIIAYSSPVPDLLGASNITSEQILWEEQSHGLLTDGNYGLQDINVNKILTYGEYVMVHVSALENILILWKKALFYVKEYGTHFQ